MTNGVKTLAAFFALSVASISTASSQAANVAPNDVKFVDETVPKSLTGASGDAKNGRAVFINRKLGNCLACHVNKEVSEHSFHGKIGPPLDGVAGRWEEAELRAILVNSKIALSDETIMPSFYREKNGARTMEKFVGKTILSAEQVEDVLAYLKTLTEE